jgi:alpha-1,6-mannosyltransferase
MRLVVPGAVNRQERVGRFGLIYHVRAPRAPVADRCYRMILPHRFLWPGFGRLWQILERELPDVVEVSDKYSLCYLAGMVRRSWNAQARPTLIGLSCERLDDNLRAYLWPGVRGLDCWARRYLGSIYIGMFDVHIANSEYTASELRRSMRPSHERPVHVCPMGVHLPAALMPDVRQEVRRELLRICGGQDVPLIIYAGRLSPEKHLAVLPDIAAALISRGCPAHLIIAGNGPLRSRLTARLNEVAPGRAHFLGHVDDRQRLSRYVASSDVFLHPNPAEPFGIAPLEAMAAGTPLVAPSAGGVLSYATQDNAWLATPESSAFADAIRAVLANPDERLRRVRNAQLSARGFAWPLAAAQIFQTYDRAHATRLGRAAVTERAPRDGGHLEMTWPVPAESVAAFGRGIPAGSVAPPSQTPGMLGRGALPSGRRAPKSTTDSADTGH